MEGEGSEGVLSGLRANYGKTSGELSGSVQQLYGVETNGDGVCEAGGETGSCECVWTGCFGGCHNSVHDYAVGYGQNSVCACILDASLRISLRTITIYSKEGARQDFLIEALPIL